MSGFDKKRLKKIQGKEKTGEKHTIMLVDDEECNLKSLVSLLSEDYNIITAKDGQEALDSIQKMMHPAKIPLIISDQRMPRLTGIELFKKLKEIIPNTIRIILTAYDDKDVLTDAVNNGIIHEFILKPFNPDYLLKEVNAIEVSGHEEKKN